MSDPTAANRVRISGWPIDDFKEGWALNGSRSEVGHYWMMVDEESAKSGCGRVARAFNRNGVNLMLGVGDFAYCRTCLKNCGVRVLKKPQEG